MLAAAAITLTTLAAKAPEAVFLKARNLVAEATDPVEGLSAAIAAIKGAQESCSADKEADAPLRRVLDQTLAGYERRHSLATVKPQVRRMPARHARHRRRSMAHCFPALLVWSSAWVAPRVVLRGSVLPLVLLAVAVRAAAVVVAVVARAAALTVVVAVAVVARADVAAPRRRVG